MLLTLAPGYSMPKTLDWGLLRFDTFSHFCVFGILTLLLIVGFTKQYSVKSFKLNPVRYAIAVGVLYGIGIEVFQGLIPGRSPDIFDIMANTIGCFTGWGGFYLIYKT